MHTRKVVDGQTIEIPPGVMDPVIFKTGTWFARTMRRHWAAHDSLLDLGCGAGLLGVFGLEDGLEVTATDLAPRACKAALLNGIKDVRQGRLFDPVLGKKFDHVCFNPPYYQHVRCYTPFKNALVGTSELIQNLLDGAPRHLTEEGSLWIATGRGAEWLWPILEVRMVQIENGHVDREEMLLWRMQQQT